jgi:hypothetical protein
MLVDIAARHDIADDADPNRGLLSSDRTKWIIFSDGERLHPEVDHVRWHQGHRTGLGRQRRD